jgi:hypothetical protein
MFMADFKIEDRETKSDVKLNNFKKDLLPLFIIHHDFPFFIKLSWNKVCDTDHQAKNTIRPPQILT